MNITTILPVSRIQYLDRVLESLLNQTYKPNNLFVIFDGHENQFLEVRNKIVGLNFEHVICAVSTNLAPAHTIPDRRRHIANIHNQFKDLIDETDWIFSIEDDGVLPSDALDRLVKASKTQDNVGMVTGVELGRWGVPYVGAWTVDNIEEVKYITSVENRVSVLPTTIDEVDACGLYCALIKADQYKEHTFFNNNGLGPDVNLGLFLRKRGLKNYIDWGIPVTHLTFMDNKEVEITPFDKTRVVKLKLLSGSTWQASH